MSIDLTKFSENIPVLDKVRALQKMMQTQEQADVPSHFIQGGGVAAKTVLLKAGTMVVGEMHRCENMNIMTSGEILIVTDGAPVRYLVEDSPVIVVSPPGTKRAAFVIKDTYWTTILPTNEKELEEVTRQFIVPEDEQEEFIALLSNTKLIQE